MSFKNVILKKYWENGEAIKHLRENGVPPAWMLTAYGKKLKKYSDDTIRTFGEKGKDQHNKNYVEEKMAKEGKEYCGKVKNIMAVTGPNVEKHIQVYLRSKFAQTMHIPEINPWTYNHMHDLMKQYPEFYENRVNLHFAPVQTFKVDDCKFVDLDLMQTYNEVRAAIQSWLEFQSLMVDGPKAFTYTAAIRKDGGSRKRFNNHVTLFKTLGADLVSIDGQKGIFPSAKEYG